MKKKSTSKRRKFHESKELQRLYEKLIREGTFKRLEKIRKEFEMLK